MSHWNKLSLDLDRIDSWLTFQKRMHLPPPIFRLAANRFNRDSYLPSWLQALDARVHRREHSGALEISISKNNLALPSDEREEILPAELVSNVLDLSKYEDPRILEPSETIKSGTVLEEFSTRGFVSENGKEIALPAVGPGGRVTFYSGHSTIEIDMVIRRRVETVPSEWRSVHEIVPVIAQHIPEARTDMQIFAAFGYFEASKYETQDWLRPCCVFVFQQSASQEAGPGWRYVMIEPATFSPDLDLASGLESFRA